MNASKSLKENYIYNFISQILTLIIPIATTPYVSRVLHEGGNGQYSYSFSIVTYFILFANLGFNIYGQREISTVRKDDYLRNKKFYEILIVKLITTLISLSVLFVLLARGVFGQNYNTLILILSIQVISVVFDINFYYQGIENFKAIAIRTIVLKLLGMLGIFLFIRTENDTWIYALCISVSTLFSYLIMWPAVLRYTVRIPIRKLSLWNHLKPSILIFLPTLAVTVYSVFDKTMIGLLANNPDVENGCYEQAYKINSIALMIITIISSIFTSRNSYNYANGEQKKVEEHLYFASNYVLFFSFPLIFGFLALSDNLSYWFLGIGYETVPVLLKIMSIRFLMSGFGEVFGNQLFIAIGREKYPTIASFLAAAINVILNYYFIKIWGAVGAAITTIISESIVTFVLSAFVVSGRYLSLRKIFKMAYKYCFSSIIMFVFISFLQSKFAYGIFSFLIITILGAISYSLCLLMLKDKFLLGLLRDINLKFHKTKIWGQL